MVEFLAQYGLFLAEAVTVVVAVAVTAAVIVSLSRRERSEGELRVRDLNERYRDMNAQLERAVLPAAAAKSRAKSRRKDRKRRDKSKVADEDTKRLYVLAFRGDVKASGVGALREEITAVLSMARPADEVLLRIENPGGLVHEHGLAASQLLRLRRRGIRLVASVDKVAASGGYLMACVADRVVAAPFAILGSIGVLMQLPNFHRLLDSHGVDFEQVTAGEYKRTLTMFGRNSEADRAKVREEVQDVHELFKSFVAEHRPQLDMARVATGEHWYGLRALELDLCDELITSDDYLLEASRDARLFEVRYVTPKTMGQRLASSVEAIVDRLHIGWSSRQSERHLAR